MIPAKPAMVPLLVHPGKWFPLVVVLPFTVIAVCSAAVLSRLVERWPSYPNPLGEKEKVRQKDDAEFSYRVITKRSCEG